MVSLGLVLAVKFDDCPLHPMALHVRASYTSCMCLRSTYLSFLPYNTIHRDRSTHSLKHSTRLGIVCQDVNAMCCLVYLPCFYCRAPQEPTMQYSQLVSDSGGSCRTCYFSIRPVERNRVEVILCKLESIHPHFYPYVLEPAGHVEIHVR